MEQHLFCINCATADTLWSALYRIVFCQSPFHSSWRWCVKVGGGCVAVKDPAEACTPPSHLTWCWGLLARVFKCKWKPQRMLSLFFSHHCPHTPSEYTSHRCPGNYQLHKEWEARATCCSAGFHRERGIRLIVTGTREHSSTYTDKCPGLKCR